MPINNAGQFTADIEAFIQDEMLPVAQRQLVLYQCGTAATMPEGRGTTYTATRWNRIPLPYAPLSEGVPPIGESLTISQVSAVMLQWGDKVELTDITELTIKHPVMQVANKLVGLQVGELFERNCWQALMASTQVNYVNSRGSRASLQAGDVLDPHTVNRTVAALVTLGAYQFNGPTETNVKVNANMQASKANNSPATMPHYIGVGHPLVMADFSENNTFVLAATYSNINLLYNFEIGYWRGVRFCQTNMCPFWTGFANNANGLVSSAQPTGGTFSAGTFNIVVTGQDTQNQYESQIYAASGNLVLVNNGSISVTLPTTAGYTYNVYVGTSTSPTNLGLSTSGPTSGPLQGQATQLAAGSTVTITGTGIFQVPPAAPASGVTVYPTFILGEGFFANVKLDDVRISWLDKPDKSDPLNQLRIIGWKAMYGTLLTNQQFGARIESSSAFTSTFG